MLSVCAVYCSNIGRIFGKIQQLSIGELRVNLFLNTFARLRKLCTLQEIRQKPEDEETINIRSTTSGMTGDTGNTVPQSHESFADTVSYEHTPDAEMQAMLISGTDRSTQDDQRSMNNGPTSISQSSKRNGSDDGWTLHGSAKAAALLASKVAASVIPRGHGGEQP